MSQSPPPVPPYGGTGDYQLYGQQQPYGQQPYGYPQSPYGPPPYVAPPEHPQGTTILVLGIVGFFAFPCGFIAWYMGNKAMREIRASGVQYANESNINIGKILGMVVSIISIVIAGLFVVQFVIGIVFWIMTMAAYTTL